MATPQTRFTNTHGRRVSTETKASWKTSELAIYVLAVAGVLIASAIVDDRDNGVGFDAAQAWTLITWLTIGYLISRGLAKSGSREFYDDVPDRDDDYDRRRSAQVPAGTTAPRTTANPVTGTTDTGRLK